MARARLAGVVARGVEPTVALVKEQVIGNHHPRTEPRFHSLAPAGRTASA